MVGVGDGVGGGVPVVAVGAGIGGRVGDADVGGAEVVATVVERAEVAAMVVVVMAGQTTPSLQSP